MAAPPATPRFVCPHCGYDKLNIVRRRVVREELLVDAWNADGTPAETYLHTKDTEVGFIKLQDKDTGEELDAEFFHCGGCGKTFDKPVPAPNDPSAGEI